MSSKIKNKRKKNFVLIGNNIRELRNNSNLTLDGLSKNINIAFETILKYESNLISPNIERLISISGFFGVSLDFLIHWSKTSYIYSTELFRLAEIIDKLDQVKRFQIESTANTFLENEGEKEMLPFKEDVIDMDDNVHSNITILRKNKGISQKNIAEFLEITQSGVANYEMKTKPPIDKLVKLSELFGVSIHSIVTGKKLICQIENKGLKNAIMKADHQLSIKDKSILILLMNKVIKETNPK